MRGARGQPSENQITAPLVFGKQSPMARPLRVDFPGAIHQDGGRWQEGRERLFRDERDYQRFMIGWGRL